MTVFSVICSCIMIHFSYGLYQNYQLKKEYDLSDEREIALSLQGDFDEESDKELNDDESYFKPVDSVDNYITMNLLKKYVAEFNNSFTDKLKYIEATAIVDQLPFRMNFSVKDGTIINSDEYEKEIENNAKLKVGGILQTKNIGTGRKLLFVGIIFIGIRCHLLSVVGWQSIKIRCIFRGRIIKLLPMALLMLIDLLYRSPL